MNYKIDSITNRAEESKLWSQLETQSGDVLPYLLERYLLLGVPERIVKLCGRLASPNNDLTLSERHEICDLVFNTVKNNHQ